MRIYSSPSFPPSVARPPRNAGYDLTLPALKSVSMLWALAEDAHRSALASPLEFVERSVIRAAAFDHRDTHADDPNLHTHVVVANEVQGPGGAGRSLDELSRRLPVERSMRDRGPHRDPAFEVNVFSGDLLVHFSAWAAQIHCAEREWLARFEANHGRTPTRVETTRARQHLTRATRPPKAVRPLADLLTDWANRARALTGLNPHDLADRAPTGAYGRPLHAHDVAPEIRVALVAQVLDDISTRRTV